MTSTALVWFRDDLRLHDNPALAAATEADRLVPVYAFDPAAFGTREYGGPDSFAFEKTGPHRARFLRESVADLRTSLRERDTGLVVRHADPATAIPALAEAVGADAVHFSTYPAPEERAVERAVGERLRAMGVARRDHWTHTLHHPDDLPTPVADIDDTFTPFRKAVESESRVRSPVETPALPPLPSLPDGVARGELPTLADLGVETPPSDDRAGLDFAGGETAGLERLDAYVWERDRLQEYKETRNGLLGADYSSKLSPWLNRGCLSPRRVFAEIERYEAERVANDSTYWLAFELRWRDFFQFQVAKHGARLFRREGIREREVAWRDDDDSAFDRWRRGETGVPFVDAAMRELNATGYVSNRARQNAASFLANDLRHDWRQGAAYFETQLVDYDACSNYGNWAYVAGVGNDSRNRSFDVLWQGRRYDPDAEYVTTWVPELAELPPEAAREPWTLSDDEQARLGVELGVDYPEPLVDPDIYDG